VVATRLWNRLARRSERGAAALEFALITPVLIMLLIGSVTAGLTYSDHVSLTNATREAARYGAAADGSMSGWAASVQTRVQQVYFNAAGTAPTDAQVCVKLVKADGTVLASDGGTSCGSEPTVPTMTSGSCAVEVWVSKPGKIRLGVLPDLNLTIHAQSVSVYGRILGTSCTAK
jgi:Flp pilus assembly protein TadG